MILNITWPAVEEELVRCRLSSSEASIKFQTILILYSSFLNNPWEVIYSLNLDKLILRRF